MEVRNHIKTKLSEIVSDEKERELVEKHIFDYVLEYCENNSIPTSLKSHIFKNLYVAKSRQYYHNLKEESYVNNKEIQKIIKKKKINLEKLVRFTYKQLYPSKWKKFNKDLEILNKDIADFDQEITTTDQFKCGKCKQRKCCYTSYQIRSSDEPMTNFVTCLTEGCGNSWRC